ncbi:hypothetical protein NECAME_04903 [Necator americanus]|uniref:Uncharacterized protein n=1 Tax=Necator americanus TaxID=51031 RepID=W2SLJ2_NECAM|nr:hypothetical protein NECAME_04903 [Necator americanus]ETN70480.1 hypothetical protein NECAME_04903 [Necator americanus]
MEKSNELAIRRAPHAATANPHVVTAPSQKQHFQGSHMGQVASRFSGLFTRPPANLRPNDDEDPEQQLTFANAAG